MGDLFNDILAARQETRKRSCLDNVLDAMNKSDRADLLDAINNQSIPATVISRVIAKQGLKLPSATITAIRRGEVSLPNGNK